MSTAHFREYKYGLTEADIERQLKQQDGRCAVCRVKLGEKFCVDHSHRTNKFRGLLCYKCNNGLGMFSDSVRKLAQAIVYLEEHGESFSTNYE
jgi:hypothetical protein